jgi:hypothetical protein
LVDVLRVVELAVLLLVVVVDFDVVLATVEVFEEAFSHSFAQDHQERRGLTEDTAAVAD